MTGPGTRPRKRRAGRAVLRLAPALAAAMAGATTAHAQDVPRVISPLRVEADRNGVNVLSGRMEIPMPVLSIPAAPNLRFDRVQNAAPYVLGKASGGVINYSVHTGTGLSESFRCDGNSCTSVTGTGSTFEGRTYVQAGTGVRFNFHSRHVDTTTSDPEGTVQYYLSTIDYPNGELVRYSYDQATLPGDTFGRKFHRPATITSSLGYRMAIWYAAGTFPDSHWSTVIGAAIYSDAAPGVELAHHVYSGYTITDLGNRVHSCTECNNALGADVEVWEGSLQLPGETSPTLQVARTGQTARIPSTGGTKTDVHLIGSVTRDGIAWSYTYGNLTYEATRGYWYDSVTVAGPEGYRRVYGIGRSNQRNVLASLSENVAATTTRLFRYRHDSAGRLDQIIYPESNRVDLAYDDHGNITARTTTPKPNMGSAVANTASYPAGCIGELCWRPTATRDALGRPTDYSYNAAGQLTEQLDPADAAGVRRRTIIEYETTPAGISRPRAVRLCGTGAACGTAEIRTEYDYVGDTPTVLSNSLLVAIERRISGTTILTTGTTYDLAGRPLSVDGPLPGTDDATYACYDSVGRRVREIGPRPANGLRLVQRHTYRNSDDRVTRTETGTVTDPACTATVTVLSRVDHGYDSRRNPVREALVSGATTYSLVHRKFDDRGQLECEARRMNPAVFDTVTADACLLGAQGTLAGDHGPDRIARNLHDSAGQLMQVQRGYLTPLQQNEATYSFSPNGRRTSVTDANGNRAELRYDGFDRLRRWVFPSRTVDGAVNEADYEEYGYDLVGNRTSLRKRDGSVLTYQYDDLDRMIRKTVPERPGLAATYTRDVFYDYDVRDLMTYARFDSATGHGIANVYDGFGRLTTSTGNVDGMTRAVTRSRDDVNNRTTLTYGGQAYLYDFDGAGRLEGVYQGSSVTATALLTAFSYTPLGQVDLRNGNVSSVDHSYDPVGRLTAMAHAFAGSAGNVTLGLGYNPASQIVTRTRSNDAYAWTGGAEANRPYGVNGLNQYTAAGAATFAYDANGNLTSDGTNTYVYDVENRLVAVSGARTANLRYDPLGRLYEIGGALAARRFLWDGDALVAEYTPTNALAARYVHGSAEGVDDPLIWYGGGENRRLHADHQGSIVAITNNSGAQAWLNGYDEWGIPNLVYDSSGNATLTNVSRFQPPGTARVGGQPAWQGSHAQAGLKSTCPGTGDGLFSAGQFCA